MQAINTNLKKLAHTVHQGQSATLISAPAIAKAAASQSFVILQQLATKVEQLDKRVSLLEQRL